MMLKIKNRENGFTLIELLLVILMISVISAIAVAKFQSAMISANEASAISAMRVISQAENSWHINSGGERPHSGRYCYGKTPMKTFTESKHLAKDKELDNQKWWAFDANNRTDSTVGNNLTVR